MITANYKTVGIAYAPLLLLLLPLVIGAPWTLSDYVIGGVLLFVAGSIFLLLMNISSRRYRIFAVVILVLIFMITWAELAVGLFGSPWAGS